MTESVNTQYTVTADDINTNIAYANDNLNSKTEQLIQKVQMLESMSQYMVEGGN